MASTNSKQALRPLLVLSGTVGGLLLLVLALGSPPATPQLDPQDPLLPREVSQPRTQNETTPRIQHPGETESVRASLVVRGRLSWPAWASVPAAIPIHFSLQNAPAQIRTTTTDPHGNFSLAKIAPGNWRVAVELPGFQPLAVLFTFEPGSSPHILLSLRAATAIRGQVRNALGQPIPGVLVTAMPVVADPTIAAIPLTGPCDTQGNFLIDGARPGSWRLHPGPPRSPLGDSVAIELTEVEVRVDLLIRPTGRAVATVVTLGTEVGVPQIRVLAELQSRSAGQSHSEAVATNPQGIALFPALPPGQYTFSALAGGRIGRVVRATVTLDGVARPRLEIHP